MVLLTKHKVSLTKCLEPFNYFSMKKTKRLLKNYFGIILILSIVFVALTVHAQQNQQQDQQQNQQQNQQQDQQPNSGVSFKGHSLVPSCPNGACGFNELIAMVNHIIKFIIVDIATPIAAIVFVYAGILLIFSGGDSGKITKAKAMLKNLVIGFVIVLAAWLIVNTILSTLGFTGSFLTH